MSPEAKIQHRSGAGHGWIVAAASLGTVFEWYDFFIYGTLAATLGHVFLPPGNPTLQLLLVLASFAVGFGFRPLGAAIFGYLGDRFGRKYTFLATIVLMGGATAGIGLLPGYSAIGVVAPLALVALRIVQGVALGGEYGGAAIYVAEYSPAHRRGFYTSFIQGSGTAGFLLSLIVVIGAQLGFSDTQWREWGWRAPFLLSLALLGISIWVRLKLGESPVFEQLRAKGEVANNPLKESFARPGNVKRMWLAFAVVAGPVVIWYLAQFQTLYFLQGTLHINEMTSRLIAAACALVGLLWFPLFGLVSDRVGRKPPIIIGYALTLVLIFPLFHVLANAANPALARAAQESPVVLEGPDCRYNPLRVSGQSTICGQIIDHLVGRGIPYATQMGAGTRILIGGTPVASIDPAGLDRALERGGYSSQPVQPGLRQIAVMVLIILVFGLLSAATYAPVAALLTELFPADLRYSSLSLPYHIGTGYIGGLLPFVSQFLISWSGDPFAGFWYTVAVIAFSSVVMVFWLPETAGPRAR